MKRIAIMGSTGSIGQQTVDVVLAHPELFTVSVLAANASDEILEKQIEVLSPDLAVLSDEGAASRLKSRYRGNTRIEAGRKAFVDAAAYSEADIIVTAMTGFAGLEPTLKALDAKKDIALANKETLVVAGELIMKRAHAQGSTILPVDSEHSAIFQCLQGEQKKSVERIILTASGGPFRGKTAEELTHVTVKECLTHPTWKMGPKITVDSATLINKGLEVIEAHWLYDMPYDAIEVVIHPESIVHSMVGFTDGTIMAELGPADMRLPIQYALGYPERHSSNWGRLDFGKLKSLSFAIPDTETFRGLALAYEAGRRGGTMPCILNAANEVAVASFLERKIRFLDIYATIEYTLEKCLIQDTLSLETFLTADAEARIIASEFLRNIGG